MDARGGVGTGSFRRRLVCALATCAALACWLAPATIADVVKTDRGRVSGIETATTKQYLGIPYAAPPAGELRWRPPQPLERWRGVRDATQFGNHCPQLESSFGSGSSTEDCLYLNIYTPKNKKPAKSTVQPSGKKKAKGHGPKRHPVMVWIHGGGFVVGESDDYDPTRLVERGVVVVTINYRLGFLGFLAHPALSAESDTQSSGNYGLMDQQAALRWVQQNIKRFGGDPDNVTIFGQSAGGLSVHSQLASPLANGLFDRAVAQSGAYDLDQRSLADAEAEGSALAEGVGCPDQTAACLRELSLGTLLARQPSTPGAVGPNLDGHVLPASVRSAFETGQFNRVPVIEGSTHDEFSIFYATNVEFVFGVIPKAFYPVVLNLFVATLGLDTTPAAVAAEYPINAYPSVAEAVTAIGTDAIFACPGRVAAQALSQHVPTFAYEFNDPNAPQLFERPASFPYRAYHAAELAYLFDSTTLGGHAPFTPDQEALASAMVGYWTNFARAGDPNGPALPAWPAYTLANDTYQSLEPPTPRPITGFAADHHCDFWDSL